MKRCVLPYYPEPYTDELLSSWLERIGLFYGVGYHVAMASLFLNEGPAAWDGTGDVDADPRTRDALCAWTDRQSAEVPRVLDSGDPDRLDIAARVTYCPACWDDDTSRGRSPHVRRQWARWTTVTCAVHEIWLSARRPRLLDESRMNGWAPVWRSRPQWAEATGQRYDSLYDATATAFVSETFDRPVGRWPDFEAEVSRALGRNRDPSANPFGPASTLVDVVTHEFAGLRRDVRLSLQIRPPSIRLDDLDLSGYKRPEPVWIANRIACIAIVVELARMSANREPLFPRVRPLVESAECARALRARRFGLTNDGNLRRARSALRPQSHH
jgi:hypothetical protein